MRRTERLTEPNDQTTTNANISIDHARQGHLDRLIREALKDIIDVRPGDAGTWYASVIIDDDDEGDEAYESIVTAVGGFCDVRWTGDANTGRDGVTTSDVRIAWRP